MKSTISKASKELAETVSADLLSRKTTSGNPMFTRKDFANGFEITGKEKVNGESIKVVLFRFLDMPTRFDYDERLLSF